MSCENELRAGDIERAQAEAQAEAKKLTVWASVDDPDFAACLHECARTLQVKGADYTVGSVDRLANFKTAAGFFGMTPFQTLGVLLYKHMTAVFNYIKSGGQSEPIEGRIVDVINYNLLLYKMIQEQKRIASGWQPGKEAKK